MKKDAVLLIVDDNLNFVNRVISLLEESCPVNGIDIASNYEEACRMFFREEHPVVLLDINLPGKNGLELLRLFKKTRQSTEVIMISNHTDPYYREQCLELGASYFLDKSNDFPLLPALIGQRMAG